MEINLDLLSIQNPWWKKGVIDFDPLLDNVLEEPFKIWKSFIKDLDIKKDGIYTLHGSRGVGKSTIIKVLIKDLIQKKRVNSKNIFYYSCHNIDTYEQLNELIKIYLAWRSSKKNSHTFIFIDEITLIKNWAEGIKYLTDAGKLKNTTTFLIGSTLLTGKQGRIEFRKEELIFNSKTKNKILTTLDFKSFIKLVNPKIFNKIKNFKKYSKKKFGQLDYYLDVYFLTGGFISSISSFASNGAVNQKVYKDYLAWLIGDMAKLGRNVILMRQILEQVLLNLGQQIGYKTIANKTDAKIHLTIEDYLKILESTFSLKLVYQSDNKGNAYASKAKKVYFRDPFLFWLFYSYIHGSLNYWKFSRERLHEEKIFSALVENVIFSHLIKDETFDNWGKRVTFWRDSNRKKQIEFLVKTRSEGVSKKKEVIIPILVRYNKKITNTDMNIFSKAGFKNGIIISKDKMVVRDNVKIIPLVYFLLNYKELIG